MLSLRWAIDRGVAGDEALRETRSGIEPALAVKRPAFAEGVVDAVRAGLPVGAERPVRVWARARRPDGLVERTRWLFCLCVLASLALTLPAPLVAANATTLLLVVVSSGALVTSWVYRYLTGTDPLSFDVMDAAAVLGFALACPSPIVAFGVAFAALWFRAVYGSTRRVVLHGAGTAAGIMLALPLWGLVPGHAATVPAGPVLAALPIMALTVVVARHLALGLFGHEQAQLRDAALARLGTQLLAVADRDRIREHGWETVATICAATPGLRVLVVDAAADGLRVTGHAGPFRRLPSTLPRAILPGSTPAGEVRPLADNAPLAGATGAAARWVCTALPERPDAWMLIGAPSGVPAEAVVALRSLTNQVTLALRNSAAHQDLASQARTDSLTGLANRATFTTALQLGLRDPDDVLAVLFLDLDDFKTVNDGLGHAAGDELLRHIAARLRSAVRTGDLCARLGGDEFAVLLHHAGRTSQGAQGSRGPQDVADVIAQRLVELVAAPVTLMGRVARVGASIGLARTWPDASAEQLVQRADIAMYAAKAKGKNRVQTFDPSLLQADVQAAFEAELAAAADAGQLVVHYQPILSVLDGRCTAVEALVRWQHPSRGLLPPNEFVGTAERTGAIIGIGAAVLRQACIDATHWPDDHGVPLRMHVNVSAAQLTDPAFVDTVRGCLTEFAFAPQQLVLEVTETMVLSSPAVRSSLGALAAAGVALAIDDFGTGYSALTTLRTLPISVVKIDESFVADCPTNPADQAVVEAIVQMAGRLGLQTIAEGVERLEQQQYLRAVGADAMQGFLHLRPAPAPDVERWLRTQPQTQQPHADHNIIPLPRRRTAEVRSPR